MPFPITCTACEKTFSIADDVYERKVRGRVVTIKCKQCQAGIRIDDTHGRSLAAVAAEAPRSEAPPATATSAASVQKSEAKVAVEPVDAAKDQIAPDKGSPLNAEVEVAATKPPSVPASPKGRPASFPPRVPAFAAMTAPKAQPGAAPRAPLGAAKSQPVASVTAPKVQPVAAAPRTQPVAATTARAQPVVTPPAESAAAATPKAPEARVIPPSAVPSTGKAEPAKAAAPKPALAPVVVPALPAATLWAVDYPDGQDRELTARQISAELASGAINEATLVWREGMDEWKELGQVPELLAPIPEPPVPRHEPASAPDVDAQRPRPFSAPGPLEPLGPRARAASSPSLPEPAAPRVRAASSPTLPEPAPPRARAPSSPALPEPFAPPPRAASSVTLQGPTAPRARAASSPALQEPVAARARGTSSVTLQGPTAPRARAASSPGLPDPFAQRARALSSPALPELAAQRPGPQLPSAPSAPAPLANAPAPFSPFDSPLPGPAFSAATPTTGHAPAPFPASGAPIPSGALPLVPFPTPSSPPPFATLQSKPIAASAAGAGVAEEWPRKSRVPLIVGVVVVLLAIGGGILFLTRPDEPLPPPIPISELPSVTPTVTHPSQPSATDTGSATAVGTSTNREGLMVAPSSGPSATPNAGFAELFASGARRADEKQGAGGANQRFDPNAAKVALTAASTQVADCREKGGPAGKATIVVTFDPSGKVASAIVSDAPFAGTSSGACIASAMKRATVPAFSGLPGTVTKTIIVQ